MAKVKENQTTEQGGGGAAAQETGNGANGNGGGHAKSKGKKDNGGAGRKPRQRKPPAAKKKSDNLPSVKADSKGLLQPRTIDEEFRMASAYSQSGMVPKEYTGLPAKVFTAMQYARELGLKPLTAMREVAVINGRPSIFGSLPLSLVRASGKLRKIREFLFDDDYLEINYTNKNLNKQVFGACCIVHRVDDEPREFVFTADDARQAGLLDSKDEACWTKYPRVMMKYRARTMALRDVFPDIIGGIAIAEYDFNEVAPAEAEFTNDEPEHITEEWKVLRDAVKALFERLQKTRAEQQAIINKYGGQGSLLNITEQGLQKILTELKKEKPPVDGDRIELADDE